MEKVTCVDLAIRSLAVSRACDLAREQMAEGGGGGSPEHGAAPPATALSNRAVEITGGALEFSIDYLSFSVFTSAEVFLPWFIKLLPGYTRGG